MKSTKNFITIFILGIAGSIFLFVHNVVAVKDDELKDSVNYLHAILSGNAIRAVVGAGVLGGVVFSFMKSSLTPLAISIGTGIGYAFTNKWMETAYALVV